MDVSEYVALMNELRAVDFENTAACRATLISAHTSMGFKPADLAEKMGVQTLTIKQWLDGVSSPSAQFMRSTFKHLMRVLEKEHGND